MSGLRERQRQERTRRILDVARARFRKEGYDAVTIDSIAQGADVSAVTVYNYYGSKAGLLLALVEESDGLQIAQLQAIIDDPGPDIADAVARFGQVLRRHALTYLTKPTWRQVLAASIIEGSSAFGRTYTALDAVLIQLMGDLVKVYQDSGVLACSVDADDLGNTLFSLQNMRFFQFIADDEITDAAVDAQFRRDLEGLFGMDLANAMPAESA